MTSPRRDRRPVPASVWSVCALAHDAFTGAATFPPSEGKSSSVSLDLWPPNRFASGVGAGAVT
eukprot:CAMPEP_0175923102 /NCGR_PEP_ID=MMETSP0108-20121206/14398_1 /TAXON_ID=195067 ORGANISM="Goniomonas pacifica, Strain CCMP1869" /NCGR_SAMPLE_ID=MMETSP0108 /ASSEMBLY_ACC=CAM_ASM_000204 /LENGTH=62 /DNA_ID=CAMNT_0017246093 /DNA_START=149 /DNA_END=333 /DNA_ORIENTATION=-